jgi:hypothetical protein
MTIFEQISVVVLLVALLVSIITVLFNGIQTKRSTETLRLGQQIARSEAVMHFTDCYFDLAKEGKASEKIADPRWAYRYWSLHTTEFYFFHHGILPLFMYSLWVIYLTQLYCGENGKLVRDSHEGYLSQYSFDYPEMIHFFNEVHKICETCSDENLRNRGISDFVGSWIEKNRRTVLR